MALVILATVYATAGLLFCLPICRCYGRAQAIVEFVVIILLPGLGILMLLLLHLGVKICKLDEGSVELMPETDHVFSLQDRGYNAEIIPMNDIFLLDDAKLKRKYFTDAIRQDMVDNQEILQDAVHDTDREIAYFAVSLMTAKMEEISDELFQIEQKLKEMPDNTELLKDYAAKLKVFLDSGYGAEMARQQQRQAYISALALLNRQIPDQAVYYTERIHMLLISGRLEEARIACLEFAKTHAGQEEPIVMEIKLYQALHDAEKLQEQVQKLKALPKRLSPEAIQIIRFWDKEIGHA